jgi:hypothetical protein
MSEPEPAPEPKLFESQSRSRSGNKKFRLHNTGFLLVLGKKTDSYRGCRGVGGGMEVRNYDLGTDYTPRSFTN